MPSEFCVCTFQLPLRSEVQNSTGLLVKADVARRQLAEETKQAGAVVAPGGGSGAGELGGVTGATSPGGASEAPRAAATPRLRRFHGTVRLEAARVGRDASRIAEEVIAHLGGQVGAEVTVILEIEAMLPDGASDQVVRTVTENSRTLKFDSHGFESE